MVSDLMIGIVLGSLNLRFKKYTVSICPVHTQKLFGYPQFSDHDECTQLVYRMRLIAL